MDLLFTFFALHYVALAKTVAWFVNTNIPMVMTVVILF